MGLSKHQGFVLELSLRNKAVEYPLPDVSPVVHCLMWHRTLSESQKTGPPWGTCSTRDKPGKRGLCLLPSVACCYTSTASGKRGTQVSILTASLNLWASQNPALTSVVLGESRPTCLLVSAAAQNGPECVSWHGLGMLPCVRGQQVWL